MFNVDGSRYPVISGSLFAFDAKGKRIVPDSADVVITEDGRRRRTLAVDCPSGHGTPISSILTLDVSGSMQFGPGGDTTGPSNMSMARAAALEWVRWLPTDISECAITSFDQASYLNQDFTSDKIRLDTAIVSLPPQGATDYDNGLLTPMAGALSVSLNAQHKRVIVFLTDGQPNQQPDEQTILAVAWAQHCQIFTVTIGMPMPDCLKRIAGGTGGAWFENIVTIEDARRAFIRIMILAGALGDPCTVSWESGPECGSGERDGTCNLAAERLSTSFYYDAPAASIPLLFKQPATLHFYNAPVGVRTDTVITLTAVHAMHTIADIAVSNPAYDISPRTFQLDSGQSIALTVSYTPPDSGYTWTSFDVVNNWCPLRFYASGGYAGVPPTERGISVTRPNGREHLIEGESSTIDWDGMSPDDTVMVDYSTNRGRAWHMLSTATTKWGLSWSVPFHLSDSCLARVRHYDYAGPLQCDTSDAVWSIVAPPPQLAYCSWVDLREELVGHTKDTMVRWVIVNPDTGDFVVDSIAFTGRDASNFGIVSGAPPFIVHAGSNRTMEFKFSPDTVGPRFAYMNVFSPKDTLIANINGTGVLPLITILNAIIDFDTVYVGEYKDTIMAVTIRNTSPKPLWIIGARIGTPNIADFALIDSSAPFALLAGDTVRISVRFTPSAQGRTSARLLIDYDGPGSPATVQLFGNGMLAAGIAAGSAASAQVTCSTGGWDSVMIRSAGLRALVIHAAEFHGADSASFSIASTQFPWTIAPMDSAWLPVRFDARHLGVSAATMTLHSDARTDSALTVALSAQKDSIAFEPGAASITYGTLCPGESLDLAFPVTNSGTAPVTVISTGTSAFNPTPSITIPSGGSGSVQVHITGTTTEGASEATITLADSACGITHDVRITGAVASPNVQVPRTTLRAAVGTLAASIITLRNTGGRDAVLATLPDITPLAWSSAIATPLTIPAHDSVHLGITFDPAQPSDNGRTITFDIVPCGGRFAAEFTGVADFATASIRVPYVAGNAGDVISIPIILSSAHFLTESGAQTMRGSLRFNSTMLAPAGGTAAGIVNGDQRSIPFTVSATANAAGVLGTLQFVVATGNDTITPLTVENASSDVEAVATTASSGTFHFLGACYAFGPRLINPNGHVRITAVRPNPSTSASVIDLETLETGPTQVYVVDGMGREVARLYDGEMPVGTHTLGINTSTLVPGMYFLTLQTPSVRQVIELGVTR